MRVLLTLPLPGKVQSGVLVPAAAVVWHGGKPWVYRQTGPTRFDRVAVDLAPVQGDSWFESAHLRPGEQVVISGAQLLLSEESRLQIRNENQE